MDLHSASALPALRPQSGCGVSEHRIFDTLIKAILSTLRSLSDTSSLLHCFPSMGFELYGVDILLDDTLRPWMIEVNISHSLQSSSLLDNRVKKAMLVDLFNLVGLTPSSEEGEVLVLTMTMKTKEINDGEGEGEGGEGKNEKEKEKGKEEERKGGIRVDQFDHILTGQIEANENGETDMKQKLMQRSMLQAGKKKKKKKKSAGQGKSGGGGDNDDDDPVSEDIDFGDDQFGCESPFSKMPVCQPSSLVQLSVKAVKMTVVTADRTQLNSLSETFEFATLNHSLEGKKGRKEEDVEMKDDANQNDLGDEKNAEMTDKTASGLPIFSQNKIYAVKRGTNKDGCNSLFQTSPANSPALNATDEQQSNISFSYPSSSSSSSHFFSSSTEQT
ncbi:putative Tubulin-tyrosine ligase family [Monocercomonoides exilis]|uniref:putative Tubulin-tyrosine ligase family n=1 Tax=Monocercomonoides exilis TaxID=2049356 RepID=UPI0035598E40|nr:putative Tubulin-tyrosine ligase family [Monocercomonoides exilis]|eukprot:MONOS_14217.1-p1 / transcript=MONOS_14217.1 / gene=MONOS_14217 / organism=Monocercomonoides_exilis_PA203 / gene_product=unspecified product / transcript_product=unspecified product / location=Mono_scaffold00958:4172-5335(+) / protein_length=387 / sequence_SO=supercontig / SO=protein_coding / is_pseudo=false